MAGVASEVRVREVADPKCRCPGTGRPRRIEETPRGALPGSLLPDRERRLLLPGGICMASRGYQRAGLPLAAALMRARTFASGKNTVRFLAAARARSRASPPAESGPHSIYSRPAPDSSAVLPDVHADPHTVSTGQLQRPGCDLAALGRVAFGVQELQIPAAMRPAVNPGDDVIDRSAARRVRQAIPAPRAAPVLQPRQFRHERQAVRCPRHNLIVILAITIPGGKRPAAEPLPGRHRQPAHTAPARVRSHEVKLTGQSDITAVADH